VLYHIPSDRSVVDKVGQRSQKVSIGEIFVPRKKLVSYSIANQAAGIPSLVIVELIKVPMIDQVAV
jgi:hypothetical protein